MQPAATSHHDERWDRVLVGGGLQNALLTLAILERRPDARLAVIERGARLGGNHRWSFHAADVPPAARAVMERLAEVQWPAYDVRFPGFARTIGSAYASFDAHRLHEVVAAALAAAPAAYALTERTAASIDGTRVVLDGGRVLDATLVVDARGPARYAPAGGAAVAGYQKFVGLELALARPHALERPCIMDATVPQRDGFRFFYVLPLGPRRLLVEDTYFSESPALDRPVVREEVIAYAMERGFDPTHVEREETGVLPLPARLGSPPRGASPLAAGYQGGWFHPTTGYSVPAAIRLAGLVASLDEGGLASPRGQAAFRALVRAHRTQARFFTLLNRMLFGWFDGADRWRVLERFHRLPEATIGRFYAMATTPADRARIVCGRPPRGLSLARAVAGGSPR